MGNSSINQSHSYYQTVYYAFHLLTKPAVILAKKINQYCGMGTDCFDKDPDPTFRFDADPDPDLDPTQVYTSWKIGNLIFEL
jgi:hypothetical protein